ncbi:hypothetical protein B0T22DRAFT_474327 [Podospora appendiculata]|uniref:Uncharacterized protein n=1 Tax=Podospora appendiculata TaxID=314037 RepID=A0AAE0WYH5_9PEZI|nr:hypothetical protein B0T22DRAFT_474327 [Podospora appendiculata]
MVFSWSSDGKAGCSWNAPGCCCCRRDTVGCCCCFGNPRYPPSGCVSCVRRHLPRYQRSPATATESGSPRPSPTPSPSPRLLPGDEPAEFDAGFTGVDVVKFGNVGSMVLVVEDDEVVVAEDDEALAVVEMRRYVKITNTIIGARNDAPVLPCFVCTAIRRRVLSKHSCQTTADRARCWRNTCQGRNTAQGLGRDPHTVPYLDQRSHLGDSTLP